MQDFIIKNICLELNIQAYQVKNTLKLLEEGSTIPFIARYRKEATGSLDENQISQINEIYTYQVNLSQRKEEVKRLIAQKDLLTPELATQIDQASKLIEVEDLYRPYKEKKKTKATLALKLGLESLAQEIMRENPHIHNYAKQFLNAEIPSVDYALEQASYIVAENISDNAQYRTYIRNNLLKFGYIRTKKKNDEEAKTYEMYYDYQEKISHIKPHRILAINRGEKEDILRVSVEVKMDHIHQYLKNKLIHQKNQETSIILENCFLDALKRLIMPSLEREVRNILTKEANVSAIKNFSNNLYNLLMQVPMKSKTVLGFDPAFRTGCKLAVISPTLELEHIAVIYPHEPQNLVAESQKILLDLIDKYKIDIIAIGNGTASRESEAFVANTIKKSKREVKYIIVNEAGASVYSASKLAQEEFPNLHVEERSAISIARRLIDPISELVKIEPRSIGVGMYQHDVNNKDLDEQLSQVVSFAVNQVGININTASFELLKYVSGLNKKLITKIIDYKHKVGEIKSRQELSKILTPKAYEQSIGFIRVLNSSNVLDKTSIHPESYDIVYKLLAMYNLKIEDIGTTNMQVLNNINIPQVSQQLSTDPYTLEDIIKSLISPLRDPRDNIATPILKSDILTIDDLKIGMSLEGTVRNVVDFGAFIDIGLKNDAFMHISQISDEYINHPSEILKVGDIITCTVLEINRGKREVKVRRED